MHIATEMNFKGTWMNENKHSQKLTILLFHVYNILEKQHFFFLNNNIIKMENWLVVARV